MTLDPNNQNYFSLEEESTPSLPWWKVRRFQMQLAGIALVVVTLGLVGYYGYQAYTLTHVNRDAVNQAQVIIDAAVLACADAENSETCVADARADAARATGEVSVCRELESAERVNCVSLIANDQADPSLCSALSGDDETACRDGATLVAAKKAGDYSMCTTIESVTIREGCQKQLLQYVIANNACETYGIDATTCNFPELLDGVVASGDPSGCLQFHGEQRATCDDVFGSIDQDGDGLVLVTESTLGTSDTNADTDGDGYTDGEEVASGHDPLQ